MRHPTLLALAMVTAGPLAAADLIPNTDSAFGVVYEKPITDDFQIGKIDGTWERADRYAAEAIFAEKTRDRLVPRGGFHLAYDDRKGTTAGNGVIDGHTIVTALTGGGEVRMFDGPRRALDPRLGVLGRAGIGFQDGTISNLPTAYGAASGDLAPIRYEFALIFEGRVETTWGLELMAGLGTTWWFANEYTRLTVNTIPNQNNGNPQPAPYNTGATATVMAEYSGNETFARCGASWRF
jgi:hypothetical protein